VIVTPERWYMTFWLTVGALSLLPIYVLLYLIWRK
jgi:hypothetical protein